MSFGKRCLVLINILLLLCLTDTVYGNSSGDESIKTLGGHNKYVYSVTFSPDGKLLASGSYDNTIKFWDIKSGECIKTLEGHNDSVFSVTFSPDGRLLASGSGDNTIKLWDIKSGECIKTLAGHNGSVFSVTFSPDGKLLASGSRDNTVKLWDIQSGACIKTLVGHNSFVESVSFSPDGKILASGSGDNTIKLWDIKSGTCIKSLEEHNSHVTSVTFSLDGRFLASGAEVSPPWEDDGTIKLWDISRYVNVKISVPYLELKAKFDDTKAIANGVLDGGEKANIILNISNTGEGTALMVNLKISSDSSDISIPNEIFIGSIDPNMSREIVIPVSASINAGDGIANITIETEERRGFGAQTVRFALPIRQARLPEITFPSINELKIIDQPTTSETKGKVTLLSPLKGNGNGIIENEEIIQLVIPVKNAGKGEGYKIKIEPTLPKGIGILEMDKSIDIIKPGETKEIKLILSMPRVLKDITGQTIPLKLALKDYREEISPFEVEYSLPYRENRPKLDIYSYKVYDGQIGKSRGNKDGVIQQGEIIQLEVIFENRGKLGAKGLNCHLSTDKQGVVISEGDRSIGDVKPGEKVKVDFVFAIPKIAEPGNLPLLFELKDEDFSEKKILNLRIFEQGIVEITLEKVSPEVGEKMWVSTNLKDAGLISHLVRNPKDPKIIYLATENKGILKSEDNGVTWKTSGEGISDIHIYCLAIDKDNPEIMYAGTKGRGIYRTRDGGKTWEEININIIILPDGSYPTVKCIAIHPVERRRIYIGTDNGLYQSNDGGDTWAYISGLPSKEINCITLDPKSPNIIYVGLGYGGLYRSLDGGTSWDVLFATKEAKDIGNAILSIVINPNNPKIIYLVSGSGGIIETTDGGSVWQPVNKGLPVGLVRGGERVYIKYLEIDPDNPSILYAVSSESKVYITRDGGGSWQEYGYGISELVEPQEIQFVSVDRNGGVIAGGKDKLIDLEQIKEKQIIPMVNFEFDSDKLKKEAFPILDNIVKTLNADTSKKAVIKGHTDNIGSIEYNLDLSKRRAESVRKYLVSKGIAPERLTCYGYGESMPIATNETEEGRAKNRRVEIYIVGR